MESTPHQDKYLDCDPESTGPNPHTKSTEFLSNFSYTGPHFSSSEKNTQKNSQKIVLAVKTRTKKSVMKSMKRWITLS